ncbi:MAG: hypothetical protein JO056_04000 [Alphaproteobacteria bacterium]|nr:hypothetical protein [Alphaproteobacteria bacterium]
MTFRHLLRASTLTALAVAAAVAPAQAWKAKTVYHVQGDDYGFGVPDAVLLSNGSLFSAVAEGGTHGCGGVVQLADQGAKWALTVLHQFAGGADDGCRPYGALIRDDAGAFYGSTYGGGLENCTGIDLPTCGTIYRLTLSHGTGKIEILYKFKGGDDGFYPNAILRSGKNGTLFGTTGGYCGHGGATVFTLTPPKKKNGKWKHAVIYNSTSPIPGPVNLDATGNVYGTEGGAGCTNGRVFQLDSGTWNPHSLHDFVGGSDGAFPYAGVIFDDAGVLYGTTLGGGDSSLGTVYSLTPPKHGGKWKLKILHSFAGQPDGYQPFAELTLADDGTLYGTTTSGGANNYGSVFQITKTGEESILWSFLLSGPQGYYPNGPVTIADSKTLYGTTYYSDVFQLTK